MPASLPRSSGREGQSRSGKPWQLSHSKRLQPEDENDGDDDDDDWHGYRNCDDDGDGGGGDDNPD